MSAVGAEAGATVAATRKALCNGLRQARKIHRDRERPRSGCRSVRENAKGGVLADTAPGREVVPRVLGLANVRCLQPLRATGHVELERLALGERLEPVASDGREMDEHILSAIRLGDEAKALRLVEPLHGATSHLKLLLYPGP